MTTTPLPALIEHRLREGSRVGFHIGDDWLHGRTAFGGLVSALAVQAMRDIAGGDWPLRALQTSFVAPVAGAMTVDVTLLREDRRMRHVQGRVLKDGSVAAVLVGIFGPARASRVPEREPAQSPAFRSPADAPPSPGRSGGTPAFVQHLDARWANGAQPFSGTGGWHSSLHLRLRDPLPTKRGGGDGELLSVLLADAPPSPLSSHFDTPTPLSSLTWELTLWPQPVAVDTAGWWRADTDTLCAAGGYASQRTLLWAPGGHLAAIGTQTVAVFG